MPINAEVVERVATLAGLKLSPEDKEVYTGQLNDILEYVDKLNALDTAEVAPTFYTLPLRNVFRDDHAQPGLSRDEVLAWAPETSEGQFKVPRIV